jgi:hypothetical protein
MPFCWFAFDRIGSPVHAQAGGAAHRAGSISTAVVDRLGGARREPLAA